MCSNTRTSDRPPPSSTPPPDATKLQISPTPNPTELVSTMTADNVLKEHKTYPSVCIWFIPICEWLWAWSLLYLQSHNRHDFLTTCTPFYNQGGWGISIHIWCLLKRKGSYTNARAGRFEKSLGNLKWSLRLKHHDPDVPDLWATCG